MPVFRRADSVPRGSVPLRVNGRSL